MLSRPYGARWNFAVPPSDRKPARGAAGSWGERDLGEVYFEFRPVGNYMRVNAIHAATGFETFVLGPLTANRGDLQTLAWRKLKTSLASRT